MAEKRDYYEVLGIDKSADDAAIKKAYRNLAKKYHPDMNPGDKDAEAKFKEVNEAYAILSDPEKKSMYDQGGFAAFEQGGGGGYSYSDFSGGFGDIFSSIFGDFGGFGGFGGGGARRRGPIEGDSIEVRVTLSFEEAVFGCKKEISYNRIKNCPECGGSGAAKDSNAEVCPDCRGAGVRNIRRNFGGMSINQQVSCEKCGGTGKYIKNPCPKCRGNGKVKVTETITVNIPAGIDHGERVVKRGYGNDGLNGGGAGDLVIAIVVRPHSMFKRQGYNLYCDVPLTVTEATLGAKIDVPTLEGTEKYDIPEGTQPGSTFTLRQKGVPYVNSSRRGDIVYTAVVEIPRGLNEKQKEHLRNFADACKENNYTKRTGFFKKIFEKKK